MGSRPEGGDGGYVEPQPLPDDFEPYTPGESVREPTSPAQPASDDTPARWWTEDVARPWSKGEPVRANKATGGTFVSHVPKGTRGVVESTRRGLLGDKHATVRFDNGYTEDVPVGDLDRERPWWL